MTTAARTLDLADSPTAVIDRLGQAARAAARVLATAPTAAKNRALTVAAATLRARTDDLLAANARDLEAARGRGLTGPLLDRLTLDPKRIAAMAQGVDDIAGLPDPVGEVMASWTRPNGLKIDRVRTPLGVIGVIYESRPNVTADAGALCLKAGNAVILRGGSESYHSARAIHAGLVAGLEAAGLPAAAIQIVPSTDRALVGALLAASRWLDVIVPRGGRSLVERVQTEARVPVFAHLDGNCHVYVDGAADLDKARAILLNSKLRRVSVCGAAETLLIDRAGADRLLKPLIAALIDNGCAVRGDDAVMAADARASRAEPADWDTEYLDAVIAAKLVEGVDGAIAHIETHGSHHTETIVTENAETARRFMAGIDSAILLHNASTQFADGGEFGMGAEIGIATGKMHARGPVGVEQLCSFKYLVHGDGQIRP